MGRPPSTDNKSDPVFGSAAGLLLNWEPFTFGQRKSKIESAQAFQDYQQADAANEIFQHQVRTINAYLDLVMAIELIEVLNKNLERPGDNLRIVRSLAQSGLDPGKDTALYNAELSSVRIELLNHEKVKATQEITLQEFLGGDATYGVDRSFFLTLPTTSSNTSFLEQGSNKARTRLEEGSNKA